jgi:hypothetical protein
MQDQPDASELVRTVAGFLEREIIPSSSDPRLRFRLLVAANVLAIVSRELAAGDAMLRAEWRGLVELLGNPPGEPPEGIQELREAVLHLNRELCARIRAGEADAEPRRGEVLEFAEAAVVDKLKIANPRFLERGV